MSTIIHKIETPFVETFRTAKVAGMFDISPEKKLTKEWSFDFPIEKINKAWNIGLIVGASGSGKTILSKKIFGEKYYHEGFIWNNEKSFIDSFRSDIKIKDITDVLSHVGFSSPPNWLLPFNKLSNGQKFRAEIARCILEKEELFIFDEFTSVVDRTVAKICCAAISKYIKKTDKQIIALSCHYDILEWLEPDWIFDLSNYTFSTVCLRRPKIQLEIYKCHNSIWRIFKDHHYLSTNIVCSAQCFIGLINDIPVAFSSYIHFQHSKIKNAKREHRTVVLPDFQGVGIGNILSDFVAESCLKKGFNYYSITSHPSMIFSRIKSEKWIMIRSPSFSPSLNKNYTNSNSNVNSCHRLTSTFKYVGVSKSPSLPE